MVDAGQRTKTWSVVERAGRAAHTIIGVLEELAVLFCVFVVRVADGDGSVNHLRPFAILVLGDVQVTVCFSVQIIRAGWSYINFTQSGFSDIRLSDQNWGGNFLLQVSLEEIWLATQHRHPWKYKKDRKTVDG